MWCACDKAPPPPIVLRVWDHSSPAYGSWLVTAALVSMMLHQKWPGKSEIPSLPSFLLPISLSSCSLSPLSLPPPSSSPLYATSSLPFFLSLISSLLSSFTRPTIPTLLKGQAEAASPEECEVIEKDHLILIGCRYVYTLVGQMSHMQLYPCSHGYEANALWLHCMHCTWK